MPRPVLAALVSALLGCAGPAPAPSEPPARDVPSAAAMELSGRLSRKGPAETSYWAITDASGKVWQIVGAPAAIDARFRDLQNGPVTLRVVRVGGPPIEQVQVLEILRPSPSP